MPLHDMKDRVTFQLNMTILAAVDAVCEHNAIDTLLSNFIKPLQVIVIATYFREG